MSEYQKAPLLGYRPRNPSYNEILPRLYLGDIATATNKEEVTRLGITDLITIEIRPLQANDLASCVKRYLFINVMDHSKQDILSHFDTSNDFIDNALKDPENRVLVHCVAGISRSASLVIAYIMKTRSMSYTEAHDLVTFKRRVVDPNEGFAKQLVLYQKMSYKIDIGNIDYRRTVFDALVFEFRLICLNYYQMPGYTGRTITSAFTGCSSSSSTSDRSCIIHVPTSQQKLSTRNNVGILFDHYYTKLHLQEVSKYPEVYDPSKAFKCNKCRCIVFYDISVIENKLSGGNESAAYESAATEKITAHLRDTKLVECPFIFIEPQPWMLRSVLDREGVLLCYRCKRKLGKFDWTSGESCSCALHNSHMNLNLFKIMRKKVESALK